MKIKDVGLELERMLKEFQLDWTAAMAALNGKTPSPREVQDCLRAIKIFILTVHEIVKRETESWVAEFQSSLAELEKAIRAEAEARKSGAKARSPETADAEGEKTGDIALTVQNAEDFDGGLTVSLSGQEDKILEGSSTLITGISPGRYEVKIRGKKEDKTASEVEVVEVRAGEMERVTISLRVP